MFAHTLTESDLRSALHGDVVETLGIDTEKIIFPQWFDSPAVSFTFAARYLTATGQISSNRRTYRVTIWEDPVAEGTYTLDVVRIAPRSARRVLHDRALSEESLNATLLTLVP